MAYILGLVGESGVGKDLVAEMIAPVHMVEVNGEWIDVRRALRERRPRGIIDKTPPEHALRPRAIQVGLADPIKEFALKTYDFTLEQLWGESSERNKPDRRYPRTYDGHDWSVPDVDDIKLDHCLRCGKEAPDTNDCVSYLTPREALQRIGTECGRTLFGATWIMLAMRRARAFVEMKVRKPAEAHTFLASYTIEKHDLVVISDARFLNEAAFLRDKDQEVWRIERPERPTNGQVSAHASEKDQSSPEMAEFLTHTLVNDSSIDTLRARVEEGLRKVGL